MTPESLHVAIVLTPFLALPLAGWAGGRGSRASTALALVPAALTAYFAWAFAMVAAGGPFTVTVPWAPGLGLALSFRFDGLGLFFATIVAGVGTLIVAYAARYLEGKPYTGKFQVFLFAFMGSMLGVVLTDNVIALYLFWELTGFTSYFLIGFEHDRPAARRAALQALIVTAAGGLALLAAGVLLMQIGGTPCLSGLGGIGHSPGVSPARHVIGVAVAGGAAGHSGATATAGTAAGSGLGGEGPEGRRQIHADLVDEAAVQVLDIRTVAGGLGLFERHVQGEV